MNNATASSEIYPFRVVVRDTSLHLWRRFLVNRHTALAGFHRIFQVAFGWSGTRPCRFLIRGTADRRNSTSGHDDAGQRRLADFHFLPKERFLYECDVDSTTDRAGSIRFASSALPVEPRRLYPVCIGGVGAAPPEGCGGPMGLAEFRTLFTSPYILHCLAALIDDGLTEEGIEERQQLRLWITLRCLAS